MPFCLKYIIGKRLSTSSGDRKSCHLVSSISLKFCLSFEKVVLTQTFSFFHFFGQQDSIFYLKIFTIVLQYLKKKKFAPNFYTSIKFGYGRWLISSFTHKFIFYNFQFTFTNIYIFFTYNNIFFLPINHCLLDVYQFFSIKFWSKNK